MQLAERGTDGSAPLAEIRGDRLLVAGRSFVPRMVSYHGEPVDLLSDLQVNPVWIPNFADTAAVERAAKSGFVRNGNASTRVFSGAGELLDARTASSRLRSSRETDSIPFWILGSSISPRERKQFSSWMDQLRSADNQRCRADYGGCHRSRADLFATCADDGRNPVRCSKRVSISNVIAIGFLDKQRLCVCLGSYVLTWTETEPPAAAVRARECDAPVAAGVGTRTNPHAGLFRAGRRLSRDRILDDGFSRGRRPGRRGTQADVEAVEPGAAIGRQLSGEGNLAGSDGVFTSRPSGNAAEGDEAEREKVLHSPPRSSIGRRPQKRRGDNAIAGRVGSRPSIMTDVGSLLLPIWYGHHAQFVPGQMAANDVKIVVQGIEETAVAWEVTTTGIQTRVEMKSVAGGDRNYAAEIRNDHNGRDYVRPSRKKRSCGQKMEVMRPISAQTCLQLGASQIQEGARG